MLSPLSTALDGPSAADGGDARIFMSGSGPAPGATMVGSCPGCQRSMLSAAPIDELFKNRLAVFTEKPSRGDAASGAIFESSSGGAFSASASSGSSGAVAAGGIAAAVFAPATRALDVDGSSFDGAAFAGAAGAGRTMTR